MIHVHRWRLISRHPLGPIRRYECGSCRDTMEIVRWLLTNV